MQERMNEGVKHLAIYVTPLPVLDLSWINLHSPDLGSSNTI